MRVDRFFYPDLQKLDIVDKALINKIKNVLRKRVGDSLLVFDGKGKEYSSSICEIAKRSISLSVFEEVSSEPKPKLEIFLAFALIKPQKVDIILQKCVELGIDGFFPFISQYCNMKEPGLSKWQHFEHVVEEAVAQSRRLWLPKINPVCTTEKIIEKFDDFDYVILADPYDSIEPSVLEQKLNGIAKGKILFLVGPEGGFSDTEIDRFSAHSKVIKYKFSNFLLRAETAAIVLTAQIANMIDKK